MASNRAGGGGGGIMGLFWSLVSFCIVLAILAGIYVNTDAFHAMDAQNAGMDFGTFIVGLGDWIFDSFMAFIGAVTDAKNNQ